VNVSCQPQIERTVMQAVPYPRSVIGLGYRNARFGRFLISIIAIPMA
jgi:hypothetical protein